MANQFINSDKVIDGDAVASALAIGTSDYMALGAIAKKTIETQFVKGVGQTITVRFPKNVTAKNKIPGTDTSAEDLATDSRPIEVTDHIYTRVSLTSEELKYDAVEVVKNVLRPQAKAHAEKLEAITHNKWALDISYSQALGLGNFLGTAGTASINSDDFLEAKELIKTVGGAWNNGKMHYVGGFVSEKAFSKELKNQSLDFGSDKANGLKEATLGKIYGTNVLATSNGGQVVKAYRDTTVEEDQLKSFETENAAAAVNDAVPTGKNTIILDGLATDGKILAGMRFTLAGESGSPTHVVVADATITAGAATITIDSVVGSGVVDSAALTEVEFLTDFVFNEDVCVAAYMANEANGRTSFSYNLDVPGFASVGVRLVAPGTEIGSLSDDWLLDSYVAASVVGPQSCSILNKVNA